MANYELNVKINGVEQSVTTIGQLETALSQTNDQLQGVEQNSTAFTELNNQASQINTTFAQVATEAGAMNQQISNVAQSATKLGEATTATMKLNQEVRDAGVNMQQTATQIQKATTTSTSLRTELRQVTLELQNLEPGSARFQELSLRAGELRDQIADTNAVIQATAGNTTERLGTALSTTVGIGITGFQGLVGAAQLFGSENEALTQTLQKLQGLLNLTQSITALGGLKDQITQVTAGLGLFRGAQAATTATTVATTAATTAETAAIGASAVAAEGAAVATGALGAAMTALPIVGIVAGLAAVAYGLYQYSSNSEEAKKAEEERAKEQAAQKAKEEEYASTIASESAQFLELAYQLKQTTALSSERRTLINQINSEYGSTLQNISDEALFQEQLNTVIKDYIALQVTKYKIKENEAEFEKAIKSQVDAQRQLNEITQGLNKNFMVSSDFRKAAQGDYGAELKYVNELSKKYRDFNLDRTFEMQSLRAAQSNYKAALDQFNNSQKTLESLTKTRVDLIKQERDFLDELFPKRDAVGKQTKSQIADIEKLTALEKFRLELIRETAKATTESILDQAKKTQTLVDDIRAQQKIEQDAIKQRFDDAIKADADEVKSKKKKKSEKAQIEAEYNKYVTDLNAAFATKVQQQIDEEKAARELVIADLKLQYEILNQEITFGDQSVADSFLALEKKKKEAKLARIDEELAAEQLSLEEYQKLLEERLKQQKKFIKLDEQLKNEEQKRTNTAEFYNYKKLLEDKYDAQIKIDEDSILATKQKEGESLDAFSKRLVDEKILRAKDANESQADFDARIQIETQAYLNLIKTKENLDEVYRTQKKLNDAEADAAGNKAEVDSAKLLSDKKLQILKDYFSIAKENILVLAQGTTGPFANLLSGLLDTVDQIAELTTKKFETTSEKVAAFAAVIGGAINSVISAFVQANQEALNQDLQNFEIASNERKDQLAREYNQGLINREQYDAGINAADKKLKAQQNAAKKAAFEEDKKLRIAQAIIAGLQGGVAAFAGAMQLGPIAGPIVGGILAGLVATLTAVQVAQISKQKFDAGGTTVDINTPSVSTNVAEQITQSSAGGFTSFNQNVMGAPQTGAGTTGFTSGSQRVYVLESDITATQDRVRVLENNSTFG